LSRQAVWVGGKPGGKVKRNSVEEKSLRIEGVNAKAVLKVCKAKRVENGMQGNLREN